MRHTNFLRACAAAALLGAAACADGTGSPEPLNDVYVLTTVDGGSDPMVIADHSYPSGTRQVYTLAYDSLRFTSATTVDRRFTTSMATLGPNGPLTPLLIMRYEFPGEVRRRGDRVIVEYAAVNVELKPDTFTLRERSLVKLGPYGVSCDGCAPVRRVEYVYSPR